MGLYAELVFEATTRHELGNCINELFEFVDESVTQNSHEQTDRTYLAWDDSERGAENM